MYIVAVVEVSASPEREEAVRSIWSFLLDAGVRAGQHTSRLDAHARVSRPDVLAGGGCVGQRLWVCQMGLLSRRCVASFQSRQMDSVVGTVSELLVTS